MDLGAGKWARMAWLLVAMVGFALISAAQDSTGDIRPAP